MLHPELWYLTKLSDEEAEMANSDFQHVFFYVAGLVIIKQVN